MKILFYGINYAPELTGVGSFTGQMAEWLAERGHQVRVITTAPHYPDWKFRQGEGGRYVLEQRQGVCITRCPMWLPRQLTPLLRIFACCTFVLSSIPVLIRALAQRPNVLVVIEPTLLALPPAILFGGLFRVPVWLHVQDFEIMAANATGQLRDSLLLRWAGALEGWFMRGATRVSTLSPQMDARLQSCGVSAKRRQLLPNWVDCSQIRPLNRVSLMRAEFGISDDCVVALYSGSLGRKHGLELLIQVARHMRSEFGMQFVFCGAGTERASLVAASIDLPNVLWLPLQPIERLNELLNLADIHLLPQRAEIADAVLPSKLTGMLASGRPVVATVVQGTELARVVAEAGVAVPPGDLDTLCTALRELFADPARRRRLGIQARHLAEAEFDKVKILNNFEVALRAFVRSS